ncbi:hypothetical protein E4634_05040 [Mangrovimicrobium sediminis]|uniref:CENP-V/GFA domain-containing protein n=1 Tax=Mangrovimicrobium sediminis TaxID=2562682 RepID=A0A4Z0M5J3_9GAMM|nr:hypothetical protein [Haliea sp. SAOS-164]TGD74575.1 hypothetical protein E4634_05040 [Haliea sp. SAOS-164]
MSIRGQCRCGNLQLDWHCVDLSCTPRACQCDYCREHGTTWVSKSATRVEVRVHRPALHNVVRQGSGSADFHECAHCGQVLLVTATIDGVVYGALNAALLDNPAAPPARALDYAGQDAADKLARWQQNWCYPVCFAG